METIQTEQVKNPEQVKNEKLLKKLEKANNDAKQYLKQYQDTLTELMYFKKDYENIQNENSKLMILNTELNNKNVEFKTQNKQLTEQLETLTEIKTKTITPTIPTTITPTIPTSNNSPTISRSKKTLSFSNRRI